MATPTMMPAGWYPDPVHRHQYRYWAGTDWTPMVSDNAVTATDPLESPVIESPPPPSSPRSATAAPGESSGMSPQPGVGWYPDPSGRHALRHWDGNAWTREVLDRERRRSDSGPLPSSPPDASFGEPIGGYWRNLGGRGLWPLLVSWALLLMWPYVALVGGVILLLHGQDQVLAALSVLGGVAGVVLVGYMIFRFFQPRDLVLFTQGFALRYRGVRHLVHWGDVVSYWHRVVWSDKPIAQVVGGVSAVALGDGQRVKIPDLPPFRDTESFSSVLRRECGARIGARLYASFHRGEPVPLGKMTISSRGITKGAVTLPWEDVRKIAIKSRFGSGRIILRGRKRLRPWGHVRIGRTANLGAVAGLLMVNSPKHACSTELAMLTIEVICA